MGNSETISLFTILVDQDYSQLKDWTYSKFIVKIEETLILKQPKFSKLRQILKVEQREHFNL